MDKLAQFVLKKRVVKEPQKAEIKVPWFRRQLERTEFSYRQGMNDKFYVRHDEWSERTWIGGYDTMKDVDFIVDSYVAESFKAPLDRKTNNRIHSLVVEDEDKFFKTRETKCV